jgi:aromatic-amino-acid transaminase
MPASAFAAITMAPRDPILGLNEQFAADPRAEKVNLGVGVYLDDLGKLPVLDSVAQAERSLLEAPKPKGYLPIDGMAAYQRSVRDLVFGADSAAVREGRVATVQALGGTGGLKIGADLLKQAAPSSAVLISDPSWENHRALFSQSGFEVATYPYFDPLTRGIRFDALLEALRCAAPGTIVVLHACCHNPTGCDLDAGQWQAVVNVCGERGLLPFLDMAYQGFAEGIEEDGLAVRLFLASGLGFLVATSFSKSFSLYGERVGALSVVCASDDEAARVLSQAKILIRTNYSNPPTFGAQVVTAVLGMPALRATWEAELGRMRTRIRTMRQRLREGLAAAGVSADLEFVVRQRGMFSYTGLQRPQMQRLREEFGVYGVDSGRICVAALNTGNLGKVVQALAQVM